MTELTKHQSLAQEIKKASLRKGILTVEERLKSCEEAFHGDSDVCPLKHSFANGVYVREIFIPKGTLLVGKIHKHSHPNFILKGDVSILTDEGTKRIKGPCSMISPAKTKRVVYTHEDTTWVTVHVTNEVELEKIEDEIIAKNFNEILTIEELDEINKLLEHKETLCLG